MERLRRHDDGRVNFDTDSTSDLESVTRARLWKASKTSPIR
jgi:hypothetical protein